jgi:alanine racemase
VVADRYRPAWAEVDLDAVRHNVVLLGQVSGPRTKVCAVVKADGYGHGAVPVARAALEAGAAWLAVALVEEGVALRAAGLDAPVLVLSEPPPEAMGAVVAHDLTPTVATRGGVTALAAAARRAGSARPVPVHVKVDTGMHRIGVAPEDAAALAGAVAAAGLRLEGLWTHLAVAEDPAEEARAFTAEQLARFDAALAAVRRAGHRPEVVHVANSAGTIAHPGSRFDLVRVGIALYGILPDERLAPAFAELTGGRSLRPVLSLRARISAVRDLPAGARPSYGRRRPLPEAARVATVPLGYADGVPRRLFDAGGAVLVGGRRRPLAGTVTMDQVVVDCGPPDRRPVEVGDEVVLLGRQGDEEVTASEWAAALGTIAYEVVCGIGARVPRLTVGGGPS